MTAIYAPEDRDGGGGPRAVQHINAVCLWNLPDWSAAPKDEAGRLAALAARGVRAFQHPEPETLDAAAYARAGLEVLGLSRIDAAGDADRVARAHKAAGYPLTTLHVGTGLETTDEAECLLGAVIEASVRHDHPMFVETHRATVTQDIRRTLDLTGRLPELRFNADLSHWYTGHEMTYGDLDAKIAMLRPVFERTRYVHGRIGTPCCMQAALTGPDDDRDFVRHHRMLLAGVCEGFAATAAGGEALPFAAELLPYEAAPHGVVERYYYAPLSPEGEETSDRWTQAEVLWNLFADCARGAGLTA